MPERNERILRIACLCLGALLLYQVARLVVRRDPLAHLNIPALPSLPPATNAAAAGRPTNSASRETAAKPGTNTLARQQSAKQGTNAVSKEASTKSATNAVAGQGAAMPETNSVAREEAEKKGTNQVSTTMAAKIETNASSSQTSAAPGTNRVVRLESGTRGTNPASPPGMLPGVAMMGMNPFGRSGAGMQGPPLPPAIQARIDRITDSELLAPVIRPLPMALLGIAGEDAFLRAPNGQTGLVKPGDEVGGVKLLRIGINRVLVEQDGQKKELTIFSGYGGESLLPKEKENSQ